MQHPNYYQAANLDSLSIFLSYNIVQETKEQIFLRERVTENRYVHSDLTAS